MPLFRLHAEADNLAHIQVEHGAFVIPGPDLVRILTISIQSVMRETIRYTISEAHNLAPSISMDGGMRISLKNSTLTEGKSVRCRFDRSYPHVHTLDAVLGATGDFAQHDLALEGPEDDHAEFHWSKISYVLRDRDFSLSLPFTLTRPVPCPIKPSEDSRRS